MPKGLTRTSSPIQISATVLETAGGAFTAQEIDLTLNALDNEVFVITQVNLDLSLPNDPTGAGDINFSSASLSSTARTTVGSIANSNVIAAAQKVIGRNAAGNYQFDREDPVFAAQDMDYIGIVATSQMFLNVQGEGAAFTTPKRCNARVYGYRAKADSATYAALVQSELLSA